MSIFCSFQFSRAIHLLLEHWLWGEVIESWSFGIQSTAGLECRALLGRAAEPGREVEPGKAMNPGRIRELGTGMEPGKAMELGRASAQPAPGSPPPASRSILSNPAKDLNTR